MRKVESTLRAKVAKPPTGMFDRVELRKEEHTSTLYRWWGLTETGWVPYGRWFQISYKELYKR
jgi:hypothetical protein